jgi:ATP-dependent Lhr-like helicase
MLCLTGEVGWARLSTGPTQVVGATQIALFLREHGEAWFGLRDAGLVRLPSTALTPGKPVTADDAGVGRLKPDAARVLERLRSQGACFAHDLAAACGVDGEQVRAALRELVAEGLVSSDGFAGLRTIISPAPAPRGRGRELDRSGRWFALRPGAAAEAAERGAALETLAFALLHRYGVVFRRLLAREPSGVPWRDLARVYRRLEARGEIRGGRFVSGVSGEQFALPDAVERLREIRRTPPDDRVLTLSGADPLNLTGILTEGERIRAATSARVVYCNGVALGTGEQRDTWRVPRQAVTSS